MAFAAAAIPCPRDGTLTTCVGQDTDATFVGVCPVDKEAVTMANPSPKPVAFVPVHPNDHAAALSRIAELQVQVGDLEAEIARLRAASDTGVTVE